MTEAKKRSAAAKRAAATRAKKAAERGALETARGQAMMHFYEVAAVAQQIYIHTDVDSAAAAFTAAETFVVEANRRREVVRSAHPLPSGG